MKRKLLLRRREVFAREILLNLCRKVYPLSHHLFFLFRPHAQQRRYAVGEKHAFVLTAEHPVVVGLPRVRLLTASNTQRWGERPQHPPQGLLPRTGRGNT